jgi:two-component system NtrC family sensor kinase
MSDSMNFSNVKYFFLPTILLVSSLPLGLLANGSFALLAILLSGLSAFQTIRLLKRNGVRETEKVELDSFSCRNQIFSSVDQLSAGIAHEINNPLGIISQEIEWLRHILKKQEISSSVDRKDLDDCEDSLMEISRQVDRCNEIVQKLLSLARQVEPVIQEVEANDVVLSVLEIVNREARDFNINIVAQLDESLPPISTDPPLLRQAVLNLLVNARQAIERDGEICVSTRRTDSEFVEIEIRDNGCGISPENLNRVFTPFFSTKPEGRGSGLGLAICRGIIERLGGEIKVESEFGKFTAFTVKLPVGKKTERSLFV